MQANHEEARQLAEMKQQKSNLSRAYLEHCGALEACDIMLEVRDKMIDARTELLRRALPMLSGAGAGVLANEICECIGQSASTGGLARCPCGAIPEALGIMDTGQGRKYMACMGTCCGEWMIEFRSDYHQQDSPECMERAIEAWNRAPRMANV